MTFEELLAVEDPKTMELLTDKQLEEILQQALLDVPPVEETWIQAKLLTKSEAAKSKKKPAAKKKAEPDAKTAAMLKKLQDVSLDDLLKASKSL